MIRLWHIVYLLLKTNSILWGLKSIWSYLLKMEVTLFLLFLLTCLFFFFLDVLVKTRMKKTSGSTKLPLLLVLEKMLQSSSHLV